MCTKSEPSLCSRDNNPLQNRFASGLAGDDRGEMPVGTILVIALIVIPLVAVLILFRSEISSLLIDQWLKVHDATLQSPPDF